MSRRTSKLQRYAASYYVKKFREYGDQVCAYAERQGLSCDFDLQDYDVPHMVSVEIFLAPRGGPMATMPVHTSVYVTLEPDADGIYMHGAGVSMHLREEWGQLAEAFTTATIRTREDAEAAWASVEGIADPEAIVDTVQRTMRGAGPSRIDPKKTKRRLLR